MQWAVSAAVFYAINYLSFGVGATPIQLTAPFEITGRAPQSLNPLLDASSYLVSRDLPIGTCNADTPCANKACCSKVRYTLPSKTLRNKPGSPTDHTLRTDFVDILLTSAAMAVGSIAMPQSQQIPTRSTIFNPEDCINAPCRVPSLSAQIYQSATQRSGIKSWAHS